MKTAGVAAAATARGPCAAAPAPDRPASRAPERRRNLRDTDAAHSSAARRGTRIAPGCLDSPDPRCRTKSRGRSNRGCSMKTSGPNPFGAPAVRGPFGSGITRNPDAGIRHLAAEADCHGSAALARRDASVARHHDIDVWPRRDSAHGESADHIRKPAGLRKRHSF